MSMLRYFVKEQKLLRARMRWYIVDSTTNETPPSQTTEEKGIVIPIYYTEVGARGVAAAMNRGAR